MINSIGQYWPMLFTLVFIPMVLPLVKDCTANIFIACMNVMKNKPTFKINTRFDSINKDGFIMCDCYIYKVDFSTVYIKHYDHTQGCYYSWIAIKKRDMQNWTLVQPYVAVHKERNVA